jgi:hypothetical protein
MEATALEPFDLAPFDELLLDSSGRLKLLPAAELHRLRRDQLGYWCQVHGRYTLPTLELVEWLKEKIGGREALEIGAGAGDLAYHLGIRATDSYIQQESPAYLLFYSALGVPPTMPPPEVERLEALEAVRKYKPEVVVGAWITQLYRPPVRKTDQHYGSIYGVDEMKLRLEVDTYINIGHQKIHKQKSLLRFKHREHRLPFLVSRSQDATGDVVWIWSRNAR